jgi:hypothetical protein
MLTATKIEFIKNLIQYEYDNQYYDFHNDYTCNFISISNNKLFFRFKHIKNSSIVHLNFLEVDIVIIEFFNNKFDQTLIIDTIYRGRYESKGKLMEVSDNGKGYFYAEFDEGQKLEFWAKGIMIT